MISVRNLSNRRSEIAKFNLTFVLRKSGVRKPTKTGDAKGGKQMIRFKCYEILYYHLEAPLARYPNEYFERHDRTEQLSSLRGWIKPRCPARHFVRITLILRVVDGDIDRTIKYDVSPTEDRPDRPNYSLLNTLVSHHYPQLSGTF